MAWTQALPKISGSLYIEDMVVFNGQLYAATGFSGQLLRWDGVASTWTVIATSSENILYTLAIFNGKLYAGTGLGGRLLEFDGVSAFVQKSPQVNDGHIRDIYVFNNKLYGVGSSSGTLNEWNGSTTWVNKAGQLNSQTTLYCLIEFNGKLYAGTGPGGRLFEWNGSNAWIEKAGQYSSENKIISLLVYNNELYGYSGDNALLLKWNGSSAWVLVDNTTAYDQYHSKSLIFNGLPYSVSLAAVTGGRLWKWSGSFNDVNGALAAIDDLRSIVSFNSELYVGGSGLEQSALYSTGVEAEPPPVIEHDLVGDIWLHLDNGQGTIEYEDVDLKRDAGLETAIEISLFTDRRADDTDTLPDHSGEKRGWWGDEENFKLGSKLWLLFRSSATEDIPGKVNQYARESLQWMIDDGIAKSVEVESEKTDMSTIEITVKVEQPTGQDKFYKYSLNWDAQVEKGR